MRLLFSLVFLSSLNLVAQDHQMGVKFGGLVANLSGDGTDELAAMPNFQAGFFMEIDLTKDVQVQPELLFTVYGFRQNSGDTPNVRLNYVALPIIVKYFVSDTFSIDAGPQVGLLVTAKNGTGSMADVKSDFHERDFGVNLGASLNISDKVAASLRYYFGLTDVSSADTKNFNKALQFAFQFKIN